MIYLKTKFNSAKKTIKYKYHKLRKKIYKFTHKAHRTKVNSFLGYGSVLGLSALIVGVNLVNFMIFATIEYPELDISMENEQYISTLREANMIIEKNSDTRNNNIKQKELEKSIELKAIANEKTEANRVKLTYLKLKYKKSIIEKYGDTINEISVEKKELFIIKIEAFLVKLAEISVNTDELNFTTAKLLAFQELLSESLENTEELNSALEEPDDSEYIPSDTSTGKMTTWGGKVSDDEIKAPELKKKPKVEKKFEVPVTKPHPGIPSPLGEKEVAGEEKKVEKPHPGIPSPYQEKEAAYETRVVKEVVKPEIKEIIKKPVIVEEKEIVKPKPKIEKVFEVPVVKPHPGIPSPLGEKEAANKTPIVKEIVKEPVVVEKIELNSAEIKKEVVTSTDTISVNINNKKNSILDELDADIFRDFKLKAVQYDNLLLENGVWYTYVYSKYKNFGKGVIPSEGSLTRGGLDKNNTLLLLDSNKGASFVTDYKKVKLISDYIIAGVANKHTFLTELAEDKKYLHADTDELFLSLKKDTLNITSGLPNSNKILKIYDYILRNISYSKTFSTENKAIFSGISTFQNKVGICGGYSKLNLYMLSFAGISDVKVVTGDVIDADDFPTIGHAWVRIGSRYYDPTFDDPTGASGTKSYGQYKFYGLPKDLFYTNRYNYGTLPEYLKTESLQNRKNLIKTNLEKLSDKYKNKNYELLKQTIFRLDNNIPTTEKITIDKLKEIIPYYEVKDYSITEDNTTKTISNIDYYSIRNSNTEVLLEQINYNIDGYKLFKWDDGSYRLAYKVDIN